MTKVYTVKDFDTLVYAGTSKKEAINAGYGHELIYVWENGRVQHYYKKDFNAGVWNKYNYKTNVREN